MTPDSPPFLSILSALTLLLDNRALAWAVALVAAYFIGAIPSAYLAVSWAKGQDIRSLGDGNAGAGNAARVLGARAGLLVGAVDIAKGAAAALLARFLIGSAEAWLIAGMVAILGHIFPIYLRGRGGRGAAPAAGVLLAGLPLVAFTAVPPAVAVLIWTRSAARTLTMFLPPIPFLAYFLPFYTFQDAMYSVVVLVTVGVSHLLTQRRALRPG